MGKNRKNANRTVVPMFVSCDQLRLVVGTQDGIPADGKLTFDVNEVEYDLWEAQFVHIITNYTKPRNWTATASDSWIQIHKHDCDNNLYFMVTVFANESTTSGRNGTITVTADGRSASVDVIQYAKNTVSVLSFGADELAMKSLQVTTNAADWDASFVGSCNWLSLNKSGNKLDISSTALFFGPDASRSAEVQVTSGTAAPVTITVTQNASVRNTLSVTEDNFIFETDETGDKSLQVVTNAASWKAELPNDCDWLTLNQNDDTLEIVLDELFYGPLKSRSAEITVTAGTALPVTITVMQKASFDDE